MGISDNFIILVKILRNFQYFNSFYKNYLGPVNTDTSLDFPMLTSFDTHFLPNYF
jgi:hypothetical protein